MDPILLRLAYSVEPIWLQLEQLLVAFLAALPMALPVGASSGIETNNVSTVGLTTLTIDASAAASSTNVLNMAFSSRT